MKICISSGHGARIEGAVGYIREHEEAVRVVNKVAEFLRARAVEVETFEDKTSTSQDQNLATLVSWHNASARGRHEYDISVHFNAHHTTSSPMGTETYYGSPYTMAVDVSEAIASAGELINRGAKSGSGLYFIKHTFAPALLLEICFVDSQADVSLYEANFDAICDAIAGALSGVAEMPDVEPPEPETPPEEITGKNRVDVTSEYAGDVTVYVNDMRVRGHDDCEHVVRFRVSLTGDVVISVNGEDFHNPPAVPAEPQIKENHKNVFATMFGGAADNENSAYDGEYLNDEDLYVALPYKWRDMPPPDVEVTNRANGYYFSARTRDVGPWTTDDEAFVLGDARPIAETCYNERRGLPSGPHAGTVPSNPAGIDLSPALFKALGMTDNGPVDFRLIEPETA
jgi:N-acetylmuramoyl-L-alanine amidase